MKIKRLHLSSIALFLLLTFSQKGCNAQVDFKDERELIKAYLDWVIENMTNPSVLSPFSFYNEEVLKYFCIRDFESDLERIGIY